MWQPIKTAPYGETVLLIGDSGMASRRPFIINGYRWRDYRGGDWLNVQNTRLSDYGVEPTHWMPLPDPPMEAQDD